jgi:hypothetical protein
MQMFSICLNHIDTNIPLFMPGIPKIVSPLHSVFYLTVKKAAGDETDRQGMEKPWTWYLIWKSLFRGMLSNRGDSASASGHSRVPRLRVLSWRPEASGGIKKLSPPLSRRFDEGFGGQTEMPAFPIDDPHFALDVEPLDFQRHKSFSLEFHLDCIL